MVQFAEKAIVQNKPMYTGFVVLELSKVLMYDFHYNHIKVNMEVTERGFCSQTQTASVTKFRPTICTTTWQETYGTMTPVRILKPTLCTAPLTQRSHVNLRTKPTPPEEFVGLRSKCIV